MLMSLIFAAAVAAAPAAAESAPAKAEPAAAKAETPKKVCVEEAQIGSHFKKRICATPEEWERRRLRDAEMMSKPGGKTASCAGVAC